MAPGRRAGWRSPAHANEWLDRLPRARIWRGGRSMPAFLACGITGFYVAVATALGGALLAGRSLLVVAVLCVVCAASFFAYTVARRWITRRERLVLLEHVWFAEACVAGALWLMREPVLPYLDVVAVALCPFLAAGRVGCTLVGCCHGEPSSVGIVYDERLARDGFPTHLVGVRLFPVPATEAVGLTAIGLTGAVALPFAAPGAVFAWFLAGYAVLRFGLEGIRGDERPHLLGLSQPRWMSLAELGVALWIVHGGDGTASPARMAALAAVLLATLVAALAVRRARDPRRRLLDGSHVAELRAFVATEGARLPAVPRGRPAARDTAHGARVAASRAPGIERPHLHVSISLAGGASDPRLLCDLAARAWPHLLPQAARITLGTADEVMVLHLLVPCGDESSGAPAAAELARTLHGRVVRRLQTEMGVVGPASHARPMPGSRSQYFAPRATHPDVEVAAR